MTPAIEQAHDNNLVAWANASKEPGNTSEIATPSADPKNHSSILMTHADLSDVYRNYIACLNRQDWNKLGEFVDDEVDYNGRRVGLKGYREMLERDFAEIPDLHFDVGLLISDPPIIASRLRFDCTPKGRFLGLDVNGRKVRFAENVFYEFRRGKIRQVWSVIDNAAIEAQL